MAFGFGCLRLSPSAFWALTLPELAALAGAGGHGGNQTHAGVGRSHLEALMRRFPDGGAND